MEIITGPKRDGDTLINAIEELPLKLERALAVLSEVQEGYFAGNKSNEAALKDIAMNYTRIASFLQVTNDYISDTREALDHAIENQYQAWREADPEDSWLSQITPDPAVSEFIASALKEISGKYHYKHKRQGKKEGGH